MPKAKTKKDKLTQSKEGLAFQKLLADNGAIDVDALNKLLATKGIKAVARGIQDERYSRVDQQRAWATEGKELSPEERTTIQRLPEVIGKAPAITSEESIRPLTQDEIDLWAEETLIERQSTDILKGLNERRRSTFFNVASYLHDDDPLATHTFTSAKHALKFVVGKSGSSPEPDYSALEGVLDEETWNDITDEVLVRQVNEDKLSKALDNGTITMQQFADLVAPRKEWRTLRVDSLKEGENL